LEALAQKVPSEGPRVNVVAIAPWEVPNWVEHVSYMGVESPFIWKAWIRNLTEAVKGTMYALKSVCMKIVWQREFQLQEVKVLRLEVFGGKLSYEFKYHSKGATR
jgi:hypothetical protein